MESDPTAVVQWKKVAAVEEFFDLISTHHVQEDGSHVGIKKTLSKVTPCVCVCACVQPIYGTIYVT